MIAVRPVTEEELGVLGIVRAVFGEAPPGVFWEEPCPAWEGVLAPIDSTIDFAED